MNDPDETYQEWIHKLKTELKNQDLSAYEYTWDGVRISPFEKRSGVTIRKFPKVHAAWKMGAVCTDQNENILQALKYGTEVIHVKQSISDYNKVFHTIHLDWIESVFDLPAETELDKLTKYLKKQNTTSLTGYIHLPVSLQATCADQILSTLPGFHFLNIQMNINETSASISQKWRALIQQIDSLSNNYAIAGLLKNVFITATVGTDFALNISMLRAMRLIWAHVLKSFDQSVDTPLPILSYVPNTMSTTADNMIINSIHSLSAILGETDILFVDSPGDTSKYWHLKLQHILKEESVLSAVQNGVAGSWAIEKLTGVISEKIWNGI